MSSLDMKDDTFMFSIGLSGVLVGKCVATLDEVRLIPSCVWCDITPGCNVTPWCKVLLGCNKAPWCKVIPGCNETPWCKVTPGCNETAGCKVTPGWSCT